MRTFPQTQKRMAEVTARYQINQSKVEDNKVRESETYPHGTYSPWPRLDERSDRDTKSQLSSWENEGGLYV
jgi:hypothetical protein